MADRGEQIERFFWWLLRLLGVAFGYLLMLGGGLFALAFFVEQLRTGAIALNGTEYRDGLTRLWLVALPILVLIGGGWLVYFARRER